MSQSAFGALRANRPKHRAVVLALERQLAATLSRNQNAIIDDRVLVQQLSADEQVVRELLVELVHLDGLRTLLLWQCPNGYGTSEEATNVSQFPASLECERCGQVHAFNSADIEVRFQSTDRLLRELRTNP